MGTDNRSYAEGILKVCSFGFRSSAAFVAGIAGPRLAERIEWILERRLATTLTPSTRVLLAGMVAATLGVPVAAGALSGHRAPATEATAATACDVTMPIAERPPSDPNASPFVGDWYCQCGSDHVGLWRRSGARHAAHQGALGSAGRIGFDDRCSAARWRRRHGQRDDSKRIRDDIPGERPDVLCPGLLASHRHGRRQVTSVRREPAEAGELDWTGPHAGRLGGPGRRSASTQAGPPSGVSAGWKSGVSAWRRYHAPAPREGSQTEVHAQRR